MENNSQAISFANSYFSLVDGLAPGLENHLSEKVVLDWFGRTIKGKNNVTEFMRTHKVGSRHVFNSIVPVNEINYKKFTKNSRKISRDKLLSMKNCDNDFSNEDDDQLRQDLKKELIDFGRLSITENNNVLLRKTIDNDNINDREAAADAEISMTYEIGENDLSNLFSLEIKPTVDEDIEENINQIKRAEEKGSRGVKDRVRYIEANGQIEFSKKSNKRGTELHTWKRQSKLQIAYSLTTETRERDDEDDDYDRDSEIMEIDDNDKSCYRIASPRLPSLGEITEISNNLVPNENYNFGGYFSSFDFTTERDNFLENLNAELTINYNNSSNFLRTPQYVDNRLVFSDVFDKPAAASHGGYCGSNNKSKSFDKYQGNAGFVFNYKIHLIIYHGNSKCRRSLSQEFDIPNKIVKRFP